MLLDCLRGTGVHISSRSILSRAATWTVQEQGSSSNLSCFLRLGFRARSLRWCIHLDAVLSPRAYCSRIVPNVVRYYPDLCMHKYAIEEMTPHFFISFFSSLFSFYLFFPRFVRWSYSTLFFFSPEASHRMSEPPGLHPHPSRRIRITKSYIALRSIVASKYGIAVLLAPFLSGSTHTTSPSSPIYAAFFRCW